MPNSQSPAERAETALCIYDNLNELRDGEGATVLIPCDNPEGEGPNNVFVEVNDEWTGWQDVKFYGYSLSEALTAAVVSKRTHFHPNPPPQWPFPSLVNYPVPHAK